MKVDLVLSKSSWSSEVTQRTPMIAIIPIYRRNLSDILVGYIGDISQLPGHDISLSSSGIAGHLSVPLLRKNKSYYCIIIKFCRLSLVPREIHSRAFMSPS